MQIKFNTHFLSFLIMLVYLPLAEKLHAQDKWANDFRNMMEIRSIKAVESSPAHMYVLSESEGLVVFRTNADTLQWLYSSSGMERRGDRLQADVRFAYLYGDSRRLTIVEPTSVLGVYSSTTLPHQPKSVQRLSNRVYIAMGEHGLGRLSLESPDAVDSDPEMIFADVINGREVLDLASDKTARVFVLIGGEELLLLDRIDAEETVELNRTVELDRSTARIFLTKDELIGTDSDGSVFLIAADGRTQSIADVEEPVYSLRIWNDQLVVRTQSGRLWIGEFGEQPELWRNETNSGNHFTVSNGQLWVTEFDRLSPVVKIDAVSVTEFTAGADQSPEIKPMDDIIIPYPRPVILALELLSDHDVNEIEFSYRSNIENAKIRGQSFYWQPTSSQVGRQQFTIAATTSSGRSDTMNFSVDVRPFNSPPRFTPLQPVTINVDEEFTLEINAIDPDGMNPDLIRYLGVDMPDGASLNEKTGEFKWTPNIRQVGEFEFQVIATDQFGAATSRDIEIKVIETDPDQEADLDTDP
jgi:hypothetical protein